MTEKKTIAVIILNWNGASLLREYLPSVIAHTPVELADVIVADNGSTDNSLELLRNQFPQVKVLSFDKNHGFAGGYNLAIEMTGYKYTVLLNSDVEVKNDWLTPMYKYMEANASVGAVQPKILSLRNPEYFEYAGAAGGYLDCNGYPYCRGRIFDTVERDEGQYDDSCKVFWATGAALMVRTEIYKSVGGLDDSFFAHMEEIDLCWRIQLAGQTVAVVPAAKVYHLGGASLNASNPRKTYLNYRNSLLMLNKNLPSGWNKTWLLIRRRLLDTVSMGVLLLKMQPRHAWAVVKAHFDFLKMRRNSQETPIIPTKNILKEIPQGRRNIILDYFLRQKKIYSKL